MKHSRLTAVAGALVILLSSSPASAQLFDHDRCYKIKDAANFRVDVTLSMFQEEQLGLPEDCRVKGRAKFFCAPAAKDPHLETFTDNTDPPLEPNGFQGDNQRYDKLCYKVKCPDNDVRASLDVNDQFGTRRISGMKTQLLCTPTYKLEMPPVTTTTSSTTTTTLPPPYCGDGVVNQPSEQCDGMDAAACLNGCLPDCTCNNVILTPNPRAKLVLVIPDPPGGGDPEQLVLEGPVVVRMGPETEEVDQIETEIVALDLRGTSSFGEVKLRTAAGFASSGLGTIQSLPGGPFVVDSFFDVFTEVSVEDGGDQCQKFESDGPLRLSGQTAIPAQPGESVASGPTGCVAIVDSFFDVFIEICDAVLTFECPVEAG